MLVPFLFFLQRVSILWKFPTYLFIMTGCAVTRYHCDLCNTKRTDSIPVWACGLKLHPHYSSIQVCTNRVKQGLQAPAQLLRV